MLFKKDEQKTRTQVQNIWGVPNWNEQKKKNIVSDPDTDPGNLRISNLKKLTIGRKKF
jgi:hypothetical protein